MPPLDVKAGPLSGSRILVIEDEYFLGDDIARELAALGARVIGPIGELEEATAIVDGDVAIDAAVVDINLRSEMVFPLVRVLRARNVPLVFATGYDKDSIATEFQDIRLLEKPLNLPAMARELAAMIKRA
jgi:DNA-binding response OmpR family regulator